MAFAEPGVWEKRAHLPGRPTLPPPRIGFAAETTALTECPPLRRCYAPSRDRSPALDVLSQDPARRAALKEVLKVAEAMTQNRNQAIELIRSKPIRVFDGLTAAELVIQNRASDVLAYLRHISGEAAG